MARKSSGNEAMGNRRRSTRRKRQEFVVHGVVRRADGRPCVGARVRAYDLDLRTRQLLGEDTAGAGGKYAIRYTAKAFRRAEAGGADLHVCVVDDRGRELVSAERPSAPADAVIDLQL